MISNKEYLIYREEVITCRVIELRDNLKLFLAEGTPRIRFNKTEEVKKDGIIRHTRRPRN